jgi:AcrR family transcriptional regulator
MDKNDRGHNSAQAPSSRRDRKKAEARRRLYEAAVHLFRTQGFDETTIEQITGAADTAKGTFFNYFPSKEHVLAAYHGEMMGGILERMARLPASSAEQAIQEALQICGAAVEADLPIGRIIVRRMFGSEVLLSADQSSEQRFYEWFLARLREGVASGELKAGLDVEMLISLITAVLSSTTLEWVSAGQPYPLGPTLRRKIHFLFDAARA